MRVILDRRISKITADLLLATAKAIAGTISEKNLDYNNIIPDMYDKRIQKNIVQALSHLHLK